MTTKKQRLEFHTLAFPQDIYGYTTGLKIELQKCASKVCADKEKLNLLRETFNVYYAYIKQNYEDNVKAIADSIKAAEELEKQLLEEPEELVLENTNQSEANNV